MSHNKRMNEDELSIVIDNEKEWRRLLWRKMEKMDEKQDKIDKKIVKLETKNLMVVTFLGPIFGLFGSFLFKLFDK